MVMILILIKQIFFERFFGFKELVIEKVDGVYLNIFKVNKI